MDGALHFRLVTAAHHFLVNAIPFREPGSVDALSTLVRETLTIHLPSPQTDAVLLQTLRVLHPHAGGRLPSLVDRYLSCRGDERQHPVACFEACVRDMIRFRGIGNPIVQRAMAVLDERYGEPSLRQAAIAAQLGVTPSLLSAAFSDQTGLTFTDYLQGLRLDRAATLLTTTSKSIKETWVAVGYNHASNFDHDFKRRFGVTPRDYRARAIATTSSPVSWVSPPYTVERPETVLIVDDDEGTRETIGAYLGKRLGYTVLTAATGEEGLREAARAQPRTILLDYRLPDVDGLTCLRTLARQPRGATRPAVIVFTADWSVEEHDEEIRALGATILSKLCELEDIARAIA